MINARVQRCSRVGQVQAPPTVSFLSVYEDTATGLRAKQSIEALSRRLAASADMFCSFSEPFGTGAETADAGGIRSVSRFAPVSSGDHTQLESHSRWGLNHQDHTTWFAGNEYDTYGNT